FQFYTAVGDLALFLERRANERSKIWVAYIVQKMNGAPLAAFNVPFGVANQLVVFIDQKRPGLLQEAPHNLLNQNALIGGLELHGFLLRVPFPFELGQEIV